MKPRQQADAILHIFMLKDPGAPMPVKLLPLPRPPARCRHVSLRVIVTACLSLGMAAPTVQAREALNLSTPFEVSDSPAGNYLSALIAGADHDTTAAATFFREALRFDPRNPQLIERAFIAGPVQRQHARCLHALRQAHCQGPEQRARSPDARHPGRCMPINGASPARSSGKAAGAKPRYHGDVAHAWSYAGPGDEKKALEACDRLRDENFTVFRDYHAGLIADAMGDEAEAGRRFASAYETTRTPCGSSMPMAGTFRAWRQRLGAKSLQGFRRDPTQPPHHQRQRRRTRGRQDAPSVDQDRRAGCRGGSLRAGVGGRTPRR